MIIPAHSIFVVADGGVDDNIARAIENHRGMGVGTLTAVEGAKFSLSVATDITNGQFTFDGKTIKGVNLAGQTLSGIATVLNNAKSGVTGAPSSYAAGSDSLLAFYNWREGIEGHKELGGNYDDTGELLDEFKIVKAEYYDNSILRVKMNRRISHWDTNRTSIILSSLAVGSSTRSSHPIAASSATFYGDTFELATTAVAATSSDIKVRADVWRDQNGFLSSDFDFPVTRVNSVGSTEPPADAAVYGEARNGKVELWASAYGTVSKWQYQRYQDGSNIDADWVDIASSNNRVLKGTGRRG